MSVEIKLNTPCWVVTGPGLTAGARVLGHGDDGKVWVDMCGMGTHLPQMYREAELHPLTTADCARLALCEHCLGYGDMEPALADLVHSARRHDQVASWCPACGGSGKPALRMRTWREGDGAIGFTLRPLPHEYVPPLEDTDWDFALMFDGVTTDMCLACGFPPGGDPRSGKNIHAPQ